MSAEKYYQNISEVLAKIESTQLDAIRRAATAMAASIAKNNRVYIFGSGHSVIPVLDIFPRYGSYAGFFPLYDPRLMWFNVVGAGGARELLWLERQEGYAKQFLQSFALEPGDCMLVFSHGGLNAAPIEVALTAKEKGLTVITASSHANKRIAKPTHSTGKVLSDFADVAIDNCVPPEDALVDIGKLERVGAGSTMAFVFIAMSLVSETGARLAASGVEPVTFVSPNVAGVAKDHNLHVFDVYTERLYSRNPAARR
jgi:uncharacterized phosphosugar-binding protein